MFEFSNRQLEKQFLLFQQLTKEGWKIKLDQLNQVANGFWSINRETHLPYPEQQVNPSGDVALVTWSTYVYPPVENADWIEELNASFNSPLEAYTWLAPRLGKYAKKWQKHREDD